MAVAFSAGRGILRRRLFLRETSGNREQKADHESGEKGNDVGMADFHNNLRDEALRTVCFVKKGIAWRFHVFENLLEVTEIRIELFHFYGKRLVFLDNIFG